MKLSELLATNGMFPVSPEDRAERAPVSNQVPQAQSAESSGE